MKLDLTLYSGKKICVAVSGGKDSMALLHYLISVRTECAITLCAVNCDHGIRGEASAADSRFVAEYCAANGVELCFYAADGFQSEGAARKWRLSCYADALERCGADYIATAHHLNDNAETVLFNLARGTSLAGMRGITDEPALRIIRPMLHCTREEIDAYIAENGIPFVTDETNLSDAYTRNYIRHNVLPALEKAVPGAAKSIYRFSRLAAEDEDYFSRMVNGVLLRRPQGGYLIKACTEPVIFKRALRRILSECGKKDFTAAQLNTVYEMQWLSSGKRFSFLGLTAIREEGGISVDEDIKRDEEADFDEFLSGNRADFCGQLFAVREGAQLRPHDVKPLSFDLDKIPAGAVVRFKRDGDKFKKFGGGTKSLGDFLTDKKIPQGLRAKLPLVCVGSEVLIVGGVEISESVKLTAETKRPAVLICNNA